MTMADNASKGFRAIEVEPRQNEQIEKAIKRFVKKVRADGIIQELRTRKEYRKPSVKRREKHLRALFNLACEENVER